MTKAAQENGSSSVTIDCTYEPTCGYIPLHCGPNELTLRLPFNWRIYRCLERCRRTQWEILLDLDVTKPVEPPHEPIPTSLRMIVRVKRLKVITKKCPQEFICVMGYRKPEYIVG